MLQTLNKNKSQSCCYHNLQAWVELLHSCKLATKSKHKSLLLLRPSPIVINLKQKMLTLKLAIKLKVHNWLLLKLITMGPTIAKKHKCTNLLLPCPSLTIANLDKKNATHKLDVKQK
jgi:hypothetical protein